MKNSRFAISCLVAAMGLTFAAPVSSAKTYGFAPAEAPADTICIKTFNYAGPMAVAMPQMIDSLDNNGKAFQMKSVLEAFNAGSPASATAHAIKASSKDAIHVLSFGLQCSGFSKAGIIIKGISDYTVSVDGKALSGTEAKLEPGTHNVTVKCFTKAGSKAQPSIKVVPEAGAALSVRTDGGRIYSLDINTQGERCGGVSVSPSGRYVAVTYSTTLKDGKKTSRSEIIQLPEGRETDTKVVLRTSESVRWMPRSDAFYITRKTAGGKQLISVQPSDGTETILCNNLPDEGWFTIAPTENYLIFTITKEGPKEGEVHQILTPDDRQPGWRNRNYLARYDLATGLMQPLTFGYHDTFLLDISDDGRKILYCTSSENLTSRPTHLRSVYEMDVNTLETKCLIKDDGFLNDVNYSPDATKLLITGSPECLNKVGMNVKEGQIPNGYDIQLYVMDKASGKVTPLTRDFAPSLLTASWNRYDGRIYFSAEDRDRKALYRTDAEGSSFELIPASEENVSNFDMAVTAPILVYSGQSLENADRAYAINTWKFSQTVLHDFSATLLDKVDMGRGGAYDFTSSRGDLINGFYVLPPNFDPSRKYPLLVHYYGGCSPSARYCVGSYSPQYYAAQGYIFYVVNPSGAAGFGQEFAARHVNTAGDVVADDIIEGVQHFCSDHPYVDTKHIGCFSASYGGFMTQLLLTKTDMFATGISHAGISDHSSYWGEGYWGYSYSEVSMADSYPWTRKDLYVDRSPLYMVDKIHTPLLFLHGSADTNVPIGESIQMFTALKLLGQETAFVVVDGENHGITDYAKRRQWLRTIAAWFAKYLKDDPTWWDELYPPKNL